MTAFFFGVLGTLFVIELGCRGYRAVRHHEPFWGVWKMPSPRHLSFESHPYALYVKKPNNDGLYPSNSLGYTGKREYSRARIPQSVRIYCVGGSTTEAHDPQQGPHSSWPAQLEDILATRFPGTRIECINAGTAGYTSAESLAEFVFRGIDLRPDLLLVYHNVNDVWTCQMLEGFASDYAHARQHKPWDVGWVNRLPQLPWLWTYQGLRAWIARRYGKANALISWIANPPWQSVRAFNPVAVEAFRRNIMNLVCVAKTWGCVPVLLKWECDWAARRLPNYLEQHAQAAPIYFQFLHANNTALKEVADQCRCPYLDVGPFHADHFSDTIHFSSRGLQEMARRVADGIEPLVKSILHPHGAGGEQAVGVGDGMECQSET